MDSRRGPEISECKYSQLARATASTSGRYTRQITWPRCRSRRVGYQGIDLDPTRLDATRRPAISEYATATYPLLLSSSAPSICIRAHRLPCFPPRGNSNSPLPPLVAVALSTRTLDRYRWNSPVQFVQSVRSLRVVAPRRNIHKKRNFKWADAPPPSWIGETMEERRFCMPLSYHLLSTIFSPYTRASKIVEKVSPLF